MGKIQPKHTNNTYRMGTIHAISKLANKRQSKGGIKKWDGTKHNKAI